MRGVIGQPCVHGRPPGLCGACTAARAGYGKEDPAEVAARQRRNLLARMAGNIAAGLVTAPVPKSVNSHDEWISATASSAVAVARAILEEVER